MERNLADRRRGFRAWVRRAVRTAGDFVDPRVCRWCDGELFAASDDPLPSVFCETCVAALAATQSTACPRCGGTIGPGLDPAGPCPYCRNESFAFDSVLRLGVYDGALREACLSAKQSGAETLAAGLGELTWRTNEAALAAAGLDLVVPVPQFWAQRLFRRHHAADVLAEVWARRLQLPISTHILRKVRWTRPQARLKPSERRSNLRRAFVAAGKDELAGASVLLADDVMTTGATAHEVSRQLRRAGAARVVVLVVARGLGRRS